MSSKGEQTSTRIIFWTDSMFVLKYIANTTKRFVTFVANRVAAIRQDSTSDHWRHVRPNSIQPDYASRGIQAYESQKLER